ncbi:MAG: hypothetical protein JO263_08240 [Candidatus Eremiobacteraeota bacterium]|nr:hypothetical protein [Candidatus Eremiobacteraeota bacterium]
MSYGDGVYKSTDGGKTWRRMGLAGVWSISRIAIDPKDSRHVVVGAFGDPFKDSPDRGVYVTFNGGLTWSKSLYLSPSSGASDVAMDPQDPRVVYAGMWHFRRVPWTFTSGGPDDGLFKSTDGGRTWRKLTGNGLPSGLTGRIGLALSPSRPNRVFALIEAKGGILWRTDDAGNHWTMTSSDTLVDQRPFYFSHIAVDPKNSNHVYAVSEMLAESTDGGRKFKEIAKGVHVDYHAIWIDPNNPKRIMVGEDGGYALTADLKHWSFSRNLSIGQIYHVGLSDENPYTVCAAFQDNGGFCGPTNSLDSEGILDRHWTDVVGGDGMWTVPDPNNPRYVWADLEDGALTIFDRKTQVSRFIRPYDAFPGSFLGPFDLSVVPYRFNWDSPIGFAPGAYSSSPATSRGYYDSSSSRPEGSTVAWFGGNIIFQSSDRGETWTPISPDLTRDIKAHQVPSGGPLAKDVSGAEYSDTILDIEGSPLRRGEIWAGTDDGYVQVTTDNGAHWRNVTPPETPEYARIEAVAPSPLVAGTAYVVADNHRMGDYAPYIFVTRDGGATWTKIVNGLPGNQYARTVRPDTRNPYLVYAGTENGLWISFDSGARWENFRINLPTVSVRDIRIQPQFNDLVIGTHGRDAWVLDDLESVQQLGNAERAGVMLFTPRTSYEYHEHSNDLGNYTRFAGENPSRGVILDFYQSAPQKSAPMLEILDANGHVIRTVRGTHKVNGKEEPFVPNKAGINRYVWDFTEDPPLKWYGAAKEEYQGPKTGPMVVPGTYTARILLNGQYLQQSLTVAGDPRDDWAQSQYLAGYAYARKYATIYGKIDEALNNLDAMKKSLAAAASSPKANASLRQQIAGAQAQWSRVFGAFTADYHNDEDSIQRGGSLRESVPRTGFPGTQLPPTAAQLDYSRRFDAAYNAAVAKYNGYVQSLAPLQAALQQAGLKPIAGAKPVTP